MNKVRRERLRALHEQVTEIKDAISEIKDEEQEAYDNLPESFQSGEKGQAMEANIDVLDEVVNKLEEIDSDLYHSVLS